MLTWKDFHLEDDPFAVTPPKDRIIWADRETLKRQLKNAFRRSLLSTPSRIIVCIWGEWGAGKTHAMNYFSNPEVIKQLVDELGIKISLLPISIPIIFPLGNILDTIYFEMVEKIGVDRIIEALNKLESKYESIRPKELFIKDVSEYMDPRVANAFVTLKGKRRLIFERYLSMTATSAELRNAGIARGIKTSTDKIRTLTGIVNLLTGTITSRVFVWFDDLERIGDLPGRDIFEFQYFLRDILDNVPNNLIIIFNTTLLPGEKIEDRMAFLGDAIKYRISDRIIIQPLTREDFSAYVRDLLLNFRPKPSKEEIDEFFPFETEALDLVFSKLKEERAPLTPRQVNQALSAALSIAMNDVERIDPKITKEFIEDNIENIVSKIAFSR